MIHKLEFLKQLAHGITSQFGNSCEVVIHDLTKKDLEPFVKGLTARQPFSKEQIRVTEPDKFLDSILPYMIHQKMIREERAESKAVYQLNK